MKIDLAYVNPGGNPTALVVTKIERQKQPSVAKRIIKKISTCEQVGFIERAKNPQAFCRIQMMGSEFCGNALRSLAVFLSMAIKKTTNKMNFRFLVETSGIKRLIPISSKVDLSGKVVNAEVKIPTSKNYMILKKVIPIGNKKIQSNLISLEGISFFLIPQKFFGNAEDLRGLFYNLYKQRVVSAKACGLVFYRKPFNETLSIKPIIYVRQTDTVIWETSCASGSLALCLGKKYKKIKILQPSGYSLDIKLVKDGAYVSGEVGSIRLLKIEI